jgi:hypothetical protein
VTSWLGTGKTITFFYSVGLFQFFMVRQGKFPAFFSFSKERKDFPQFMSRQTGIVMNNQMDDFASPNIGKASFFLTVKN